MLSYPYLHIGKPAKLFNRLVNELRGESLALLVVITGLALLSQCLDGLSRMYDLELLCEVDPGSESASQIGRHPSPENLHGVQEGIVPKVMSCTPAH